jgi:hypothetical protein
MQKWSIAPCLIPLQLSLLPPMPSFMGQQARALPVSSYVSNLSLFGLQGLQKELPFQIMYFDHILQVNHDFVQSFN